MYPFVFQPNLHQVVWGGNRLVPWKGLAIDSPENIGESWEVSAVDSSPSVIANGEYEGMLLTDVIRRHPEDILGKTVAKHYNNKLPLLVKFIDAKSDLSIQVHPDDEMASREHDKMGKSEMWYILDAEPGAFLYSGFKEQLTDEQYKQKIADGTITDALARHDVKAGDVFYIPAGRVHAICGGILLAEVQQSSDVTYRIYDYNRLGLDGNPRELHTELASKALDYNVHDEYRTIYPKDFDRANRCISSPFFNVRMVDVSSPFHRNLKKYDSFIITMCIKGNCCISIRENGYAIVLNEGHSCLIPACIADYDIIPLNGKKVQLLDAFIDNKSTNPFKVIFG